MPKTKKIRFKKIRFNCDFCDEKIQKKSGCFQFKKITLQSIQILEYYICPKCYSVVIDKIRRYRSKLKK